MDVDWMAIGEFVKSVGIPTSILVGVLGPIVYAIYKVISVQGPKVTDKAVNFVERTVAANEKNADSIALLASASTTSQENHDRTHDAIKELVRGARKAVEKIAPELYPSVVPHLDRAEAAIERSGK